MIRIADACWINETLIRDVEIRRKLLHVTIKEDSYKVDPEYIASFCQFVGINFEDVKTELERKK